eukprot:1840788-Rhodomonas_salina.2
MVLLRDARFWRSVWYYAIPGTDGAYGATVGYTRPASAGAQRTVQLLSDLNLPSLPESEVDHTLFVEPVSDALSVDGEVALLRLSRLVNCSSLAKSKAKHHGSRAACTRNALDSALPRAEIKWKRPQFLYSLYQQRKRFRAVRTIHDAIRRVHTRVLSGHTILCTVACVSPYSSRVSPYRTAY